MIASKPQKMVSPSGVGTLSPSHIGPSMKHPDPSDKASAFPHQGPARSPRPRVRRREPSELRIGLVGVAEFLLEAEQLVLEVPHGLRVRGVGVDVPLLIGAALHREDENVR